MQKCSFTFALLNAVRKGDLAVLIIRFLLTLALLFASFTPANACTCMFGGGPACEETWRKSVDAVFLGQVERIELVRGAVPSPTGAMSMAAMGGLLRVTVIVKEAYRGVSAKTVVVYTASSSAACGYGFHKGQKYLIYASADDKIRQLLVSLCSATKPAEYAKKDLTYLRSLPSLTPTSTLMGNVWRYTHDPKFKPTFQPSLMDHYRPPEQEYMAMKPEPGLSVTAKGQDGIEHTAIVGTDGDWRIPDLLPGRYTIDPQKREGVYIYPFFSSVEVAPKGCAQVNIRVELNGRISGTLDHPAPGTDWVFLKVFALPLSETDWHRPTREATLESSTSTFEVGPLPPGKYVLGAYVVVKISSGNGYSFGDLGPFYFPGPTGIGVTGIKAAEPIEVTDGKAVTNIKFSIMY